MRGLLIAVGLLAGCGATTRGVVHDSIEEGSQLANWGKLREPIRALAEDVADGVLDAAASPELDALVDRFVRTVLHAAAGGLDAEGSPALARTVRATVEAAVDAIRDDRTLRRASDVADALTAAAMAGLARGIRDQLGPAMASALDANLGPALQRVIEKNLGQGLQHVIENNLGPGLQHMIENNLGPAITNSLDIPALQKAAKATAAAAGEGLVDGANRAAAVIIDQQLARLKELVALLAIVSGALAVLLWWRHRSARIGRDALQLVTGEIGRMASGPESGPVIVELARRIKAAGEGRPAGAFLADHLRAHPSSKVKPKVKT